MAHETLNDWNAGVNRFAFFSISAPDSLTEFLAGFATRRFSVEIQQPFGPRRLGCDWNLRGRFTSFFALDYFDHGGWTRLRLFHGNNQVPQDRIVKSKRVV
jgi:hypothetical protein